MISKILQKAGLVCFGLFLISFSSFAQDQKIADSLAKIYHNATLGDTAKMEMLKQLAFNEVRDLKLGYSYAKELVSLAMQIKNYRYQISGYTLQGNIKQSLGDAEEALAAYFKGLEIAIKINDKRSEGSINSGIAGAYSLTDNFVNALLYRVKAITALRASGDSTLLADALSNAGAEYNDNEKPDSALLFLKEAAAIYGKLNHEVGKAYNLGTMGISYAAIGKTQLAEANLNEAMRVLSANELYDPICYYLLAISEIYFKRGNTKIALDEAKRGLNMALEHGLKSQASEINLQLFRYYQSMGQPVEALTYYQQHITYRDSVNNIAAVQKMGDLRTDFEVSRKQVEVDLLNEQKRNQRNILISLAAIIGLGIILLGSLFWYNRVIAREKRRSENLLLNILPAAVAQELKEKGSVDAVRFENVTVLFTDFVQFTRVAEKVDPEHLVKSIDYYFKGFDRIAVKYGLEKIKTVGDSYMCAGGLPIASDDHAVKMIQAAREIAELVRNQPLQHGDLSHFEVRIGVHTGPVVAGIVGTKKWQYDIWGDTVNIASRMESNSKPGRVNISEATWLQVKNDFEFEYRGEIEVKGRGPMKMYFLSSPEAAPLSNEKS